MNSFTQLFTVYLLSLLFLGLRYVLLSGAAVLILPPRSGFPDDLKPLVVRLEILQSLVSIYIFAGFYTLSYWLYQNEMTLIYTDLSAYPWRYTLLSFVILYSLHGVYRLGLNQILSQNNGRPFERTAWGSYSYSFFEAFLHGIGLPIVLMILPLHPSVILSYLIIDQALKIFRGVS